MSEQTFALRDTLTGSPLASHSGYVMKLSGLGAENGRKRFPLQLHTHRLSQGAHSADNTLGHLEWSVAFEDWLEPGGAELQEAVRLYYAWWTSDYLVGRLYANVPQRFAQHAVDIVLASHGDEAHWEQAQEWLRERRKSPYWLVKQDRRMTWFLRQTYITAWLHDLREALR